MTKASMKLVAAISVVWVLASAALFSTVSAEEILTIGKDIFVLHSDLELTLNGRRVHLDPLNEIDTTYAGKAFTGDIDRVLLEDLTGLSPNPFLVRRSSGLSNGFAAMTLEGKRLIVFDPTRYYPTRAGSHQLVLAHEAGHHVCGHTIGKLRQDPWAAELEADRYAGAALRRMGLSEVAMIHHVGTVEKMYPPQGSRTHPPRTMRVRAIWDGYHKGSPC